MPMRNTGSRRYLVLYAPPGDAAELRRRIEELISDRGRQAELSRRGRSAAHRLSWEALGRTVAAELERAVRAHAPPSGRG